MNDKVYKEMMSGNGDSWEDRLDDATEDEIEDFLSEE